MFDDSDSEHTPMERKVSSLPFIFILVKWEWADVTFQ